MNYFKKYMHLERLGATEVSGIEVGMCYVFPKIDGTNASIWLDESKQIKAGSRKRELTTENDNAGFCQWVQDNKEKFMLFFDKYGHGITLYGEWLVPHTLKTYNDNAWFNFYVFDVLSENGFYQYEKYKPMLDKFNIEYIPPIAKVENPSTDQLYGYLDQNTYLIQDGKGVGEGVVIKNYGYKNRYGRQCWAKIVRNDFKIKHAKAMGVNEVKTKQLTEEKIAQQYVTLHLCEKNMAKIANEKGGFSNKDIPRLLHTVFYDVIREEIWDFIKKHNNPVIDFKVLQKHVYAQVKKLMKL